MDDDHPTVLPFPQAPEAIELRHLRAFVTVADELSFRRAAERLYLSQPALSRQIRALERLVGCELLTRSTHRGAPLARRVIVGLPHPGSPGTSVPDHRTSAARSAR